MSSLNFKFLQKNNLHLNPKVKNMRIETCSLSSHLDYLETLEDILKYLNFKYHRLVEV